MKHVATWPALAVLLALPGGASAQAAVAELPEAPAFAYGARVPDWLVARPAVRAGAYRGAGGEIVLDNGLVRRVFRLDPALATVALDDHRTGASLLRAVEPEATLVLSGTAHRIGGLVGQPERAYLSPAFLERMSADPEAFVCGEPEVGATAARFGWARVRHAEDRPWPPPGVALAFTCRPPSPDLSGLEVEVHYELYDGVPLFAKWLVVRNGTAAEVVVDRFSAERLAFVEPESDVEKPGDADWREPRLQVFSDYAFGGGDVVSSNQTTTRVADPDYTSQVNYRLEMPAVLLSRPPIGPDWPVAPGESFETFRTFVLVHDSDDRERRGLAFRRAMRTLAPWVTENPLMMHVRRADSETFRAAVDQCVETGFEMIIYTFGSGIDMETDDAAEIERIRRDVAYAHDRGIEVGAYSLFSSRTIDPENDVIDPETGAPGGTKFGNAPCLASAWGERYLEKVKGFVEATGLDLLEHDGPYPGDVCASTRHPGHRGEGDSQWAQWRRTDALYTWARERGVYLNVPDWYFLSGANKVAMGYREVNWSLPRARQIVLGRQNIYDGTWTKTPSMGWMFVPLTEYHGGGAAATLEPLREHLDDYEAHLVNNLAAGVQACYRGPRLYDSPQTRDLVRRWVAWFREHRAILESDVIHLRRADGRDVDGLLHVNPTLRERGLAVFWNPLDEEVEREVDLPLYYTGLVEAARVRERDGPARTVALDRRSTARVRIHLPPRGFTWLVVEAAPATSGRAQQPTLVVEGGRVVVGDGTVYERASVVVSGERIARVTEARVEAPGVRRFDATGRTVLPGLIDSHVHLLIQSFDSDPRSDSDLEEFVRGGLETRLRAFLEGGITTVASMGDFWPAIRTVRDRVSAGELPGPRILAAGPVLTARGGHPAAGPLCGPWPGLESNPWCREHLALEIETPANAAAGVGRLAREGVDLVKLVYDDREPPVGTALEARLVEAIVREAHEHGLRAGAHVTEVAKALHAIEAGLDALVHVPQTADDPGDRRRLVELMRERGVTAASTLVVSEAMLRAMAGPGEDVERSVEQALAPARETIAVLLATAPDLLALGTDAVGMDPVDAFHREAELLLASGLSPAQVIRAATSTAAAHVGRAGDLGTLRAGGLADLIVVDGNPLEDLAALRRVALVVKGGEVFEP